MSGRTGRRLRALGLLASLALAVPAGAGHGAPPVPLRWMSAAELKALLDAGSRPPIALVDLRPDAAFRQGHLPGARSVPITQLRRRARDIAPGRVVLYCDCPAEEVEAAHAFLLNLGWDDVRALAEGFAGWVGRGYPVAR